MKVLVKEKIADSGVELLREQFDVELGLDWDGDELEKRIGEFDGILIRSATKLTPDLIERGERLKVIGRAGTGRRQRRRRGRDQARHRRRERPRGQLDRRRRAHARAHARPLPQRPAGARLTRRGQVGPLELQGHRALRQDARASLGFGRIGQLVAARAQAFDMQVVAYDKFVTAERFRELGVEGVDDPAELYARADFITLHLPKTPETVNFIDAAAIEKMRDGARIVNCARGELIDLDALVGGLESGKLAGAALDVFPEEPFTDHPILERDDVVVTPHLGASTAEAQDRAGVVTAEQVTAALTGRRGHHGRQHRRGPARR